MNRQIFARNVLCLHPCFLAPCKSQQCGHGYIKGIYMDFADECAGNYSMPECICKDGFDGNGTEKCTVGKTLLFLSNSKCQFKINMTLL